MKSNCILLERANEVGIPQDVSLWYVSAVGMTNLMGRLTAGTISFCPTVDVHYVVGIASLLGGLATMMIAFVPPQYSAFTMGYCLIFGFCIGENY